MIQRQEIQGTNIHQSFLGDSKSLSGGEDGVELGRKF